MQINDKVSLPLDNDIFGRIFDIVSFDYYDSNHLCQFPDKRDGAIECWFEYNNATREDPIALISLDKPRFDGVRTVGCPTSLLNKLYFQCTCKEVKITGTHSQWCDILRRSLGDTV